VECVLARPRKLDAHQRQEALDRLAKGGTLVDVAGLSASTPPRLVDCSSERVQAIKPQPDRAVAGAKFSARPMGEVNLAGLFQAECSAGVNGV
jgi:hypothetical protein